MHLSLPRPSALSWSRQAGFTSDAESSTRSASLPCGGGASSLRISRLAVRVRSGIGEGEDEGGDGQAGTPGAAKKGFGSSGGFSKRKGDAGGKKKKSREGGEQKGVVGRGQNASASKQGAASQLEKVVDVVDKKSRMNSSIDPAQARLGKVDFVRVQNWGSEENDAPQLEDLKVKSFSPAATSTQGSSNDLFYEKLVNRLQLLESKGEMAVAQAGPLPSFDRWAFGEDRYAQFLVDQRSVFEALRDVTVAAQSERCKAAGDTFEEVVPLGGAAAALGIFGEELGLDRCEALNADIKSITESSTAEREHELEFLTAKTQAVGYARYLRQLGDTSLSTVHSEAKSACLKLLAHFFAVYVSHLTTGMRIGAKAMDNVASLRQSKALRFYRDYPTPKLNHQSFVDAILKEIAVSFLLQLYLLYLNPEQQSDPLKLFIAKINAAGKYISSEDDQEQVMEELPKAFQRTSLLLSVLAVEEPQLVG